jgi:hypothetical protein
MSLPDPIVTSLPSVGTAVDSLAKAESGVYRLFKTDANGNDVPVELKLRASSVGSNKRAISGTLRYNPGMHDANFAANQGRVSASFAVTGQLGDAIDSAEIVNFGHYLGSVLAQTLVVTGLVDGSYE